MVSHICFLSFLLIFEMWLLITFVEKTTSFKNKKTAQQAEGAEAGRLVCAYVTTAPKQTTVRYWCRVVWSVSSKHNTQPNYHLT